MTFQFDEEKTLSNFASSGMVDMQVGLLTAYAVICVGSEDTVPTSSHGGGLTLDAHDAIAAARTANETSPGCHYLPVPIGIDPMDVYRLMAALYNLGGDSGEAEA